MHSITRSRLPGGTSRTSRPSTFGRAAADACREAVHEARLMKAIAEDALEMRVYDMLPTTASQLPLVGLIGLLALAGAGGIRIFQTVRT